MNAVSLIGREVELQLLSGFIGTIPERGGALLLAGDPGVGKSVLLDTVAAEAEEAGHLVLRAAGAQFEAATSFALLSQLLQPVASTVPLLLEAEHPGLSAAVQRALGLADAPATTPPTLFNALLTLIRHMAATRPVLLVIDDLQCADHASEVVLRFIARRLKGSHAGLIAASRQDQWTHWEDAGIPAHQLQPLDPASAAELIGARFPGLAPLVRRRLLAEAEGNPLALLELPVPLTPAQRRSGTALPATLPLTDRLRSAFAARIATMPAPTRDLLLLAALDAGGDLTTDATEAGVLAPAGRVGLIRVAEPPGKLTFSHPLVKAAVVGGATLAERRRAHRTLAALAAQPEHQALHLAEAAPRRDEQVAAMLEDAANRTLRRGDPRGAIGMLLRAADLTPGTDDRSRRLQQAAYTGAKVAGDMPSAAAVIDAVRRTETRLTLRTAITAGFVLLNGEADVDTGHRLVAEALEQGDSTKDDAFDEAVHTLMLLSFFGGRPDLWPPARRALGRLAPDRRLLLELQDSIMGDPARASHHDLARLDECIRGLAAENDPGKIIQVADISNHVDRTGRCRDALWRVIRDAREGGALACGLNARILLGGEYFRDGLWDLSGELAAEGLAVSEELGYRLPSFLFRYQQALLAAARGEQDQARALTAEMSAWSMAHGAGTLVGYARHARTLAALSHGDFEEAYRQASAISPPGTFPAHEVTAMRVPFDLVEAATRTGRNAEAAAHAAAMQTAGLPAISPRLRLLTAGAAALAGHDDELFEAALALPGTERWPFETARIRLAYGERLRRRRQRAKARGQLTDALEVFERLGAAPWAARAASELRACGQSGLGRIANSPARDALTPREYEVASLAASGLTNKQIGARLFVAPKTVGDHLYRIFPKLGVTKRSALRDVLGEPPVVVSQ